MSRKLNELVAAAKSGDREALEQVVREIQDRVHHLAMRMLVNPDDAAEATQEILIQVITKLSTFRGDSAFTTWVYRVATNYLLNAKKVHDRDPGLDFEAFRIDLETGLVADAPADDKVMLNQLRISCTMAMLLCLDLKHRVAYVLGDILEFEHAEAADVLGISKENYRQRLSRARREVVAFTARSCGVVNRDARCSCPRRLPAAIAAGRVQPPNPSSASQETSEYDTAVTRVRSVEGALRTLALQTAVPRFRSPVDLGARITAIVADQA